MLPQLGRHCAGAHRHLPAPHARLPAFPSLPPPPAGADVVFIDALESEGEMEALCRVPGAYKVRRRCRHLVEGGRGRWCLGGEGAGRRRRPCHKHGRRVGCTAQGWLPASCPARLSPSLPSPPWLRAPPAAAGADGQHAGGGRQNAHPLPGPAASHGLQAVRLPAVPAGGVGEGDGGCVGGAEARRGAAAARHAHLSGEGCRWERGW